jgi:hypothetical protein
MIMLNKQINDEKKSFLAFSICIYYLYISPTNYKKKQFTYKYISVYASYKCLSTFFCELKTYELCGPDTCTGVQPDTTQHYTTRYF